MGIVQHQGSILSIIKSKKVIRLCLKTMVLKFPKTDKPIPLRRVLIIDDETDFAESQQDILESIGYQVETAHSMSSAKEVLDHFAVDVALVDIRMGGDSGLDLVPEIRRQYPRSLCVMSTAISTADTVILALQKGAYDYLCKPYFPEDLFATMDRCFERIYLEQQKRKAEEALVKRNQELEQINRRLKRIVKSMQTLTHCTTIPDLCPIVLEQFAHNMAAEGGSVYLLENGQLKLKHALDPGHAPATIPLPLRPSSVFNLVIQTRQPQLISGETNQEDFLTSGWTGYKSVSLLAFPLLGEAREVIGVLSLHEKNGLHFTQQDKELGLILIAYINEVIRAVKALDAYKSSEEQVRLLLNSTVEGIFGIDENELCTFVNPSCLIMLGYKQETDLLGKNMHQIIVRSQVDPYSDQKVFSGNIEIHEIDKLFFCANGRTLPVEYWSRPIKKGNQVMGSVVSFIDITDRKHIEDELNAYRLNLEEKVKLRTSELLSLNEELSAFSHSISHDLKAPLRAIEGFSHILREEYEESLDKAGKGFLDEICEGSVRMAHLIDDLLAHARLAEKFSDIGSVDMMEIMEKVSKKLAVEIKKSHAEVTILNTLPIVKGHSATLEILLQNLVSNAIKFVAPSTIPKITISFVDLSSEFHFSVSDNGIGIAENQKDNIFKIFERLHSEDEYPGTGIGLAIARKSVILHKGKIWIDSELSVGSTFHFTLSKKPAH